MIIKSFVLLNLEKKLKLKISCRAIIFVKYCWNIDFVVLAKGMNCYTLINLFYCSVTHQKRFGEGVVISCFWVHFSPIAYSLSHEGTMTISLMHQWHVTICGGVISTRRSLLYGAYGCILDSQDSFRSNLHFISVIIIIICSLSVSSAAFSFPAAAGCYNYGIGASRLSPVEPRL
ncbi:hypothetical protein Tco_1404818 [Tanacetum coccineum]